MILDLTNLNKEQQHELDKIYNKHKSSIEKVLFNCIKKEKNFFLIFSCLVSRNPEENNLYYKISIILTIPDFRLIVGLTKNVICFFG